MDAESKINIKRRQAESPFEDRAEDEKMSCSAKETSVQWQNRLCPQWDSSMERVIMVIGKTGTGKSATCNTVLQTNIFIEGSGSLSMTTSCKWETMTVRGRTLTMIDTPGTMDVKDPPKVRKKLLKTIERFPGGIDAFIATFRCDVRATEDEVKAAEEAINMFGPECFKRAILVFTHGSEYDNDKSKFTKALDKIRSDSPRFDALLSRLDERWELIDNGKRRSKIKESEEKGKEKYKTKQETREQHAMALLQLVDHVADLHPRRYSKEDQQPTVPRHQEELHHGTESSLQDAESQTISAHGSSCPTGQQNAMQLIQVTFREQMEQVVSLIKIQLEMLQMMLAQLERITKRLIDAQLRDRQLEHEMKVRRMQFEREPHTSSCSML